MNLVSINGKEYVASNEEVAQFLNSHVYVDMIEDECMDAITPNEGVFDMLCEAVNDEPYFGKMLLEFLSE